MPEVAAQYLRHRVSVYLRGRKVTAGYLAAQLGGKESAWRSRLNTTRGLNADELVALFILFPNLVEEVIPRGAHVDDWLPPSYAGLATGREDGPVMPVFRNPEIDWAAASSAIAQWWSAGIVDGTAIWAVNASVLNHQLLQHLDRFGLPRDLAALGETVAPLGENAGETSSVRIDWMNRDTSVTAVWLSPFEVPRSAQARRLLTAFADTLWSDNADALPIDVSVVAAPPSVTAMIRDVLQAARPDETRSVVLSMGQARRLGATDPVAQRDLQVTILDEGFGPLLWLRVKA